MAEYIQEQISDYDMLKLYFGEDYNVTDKIKIKQPTIGDIISFGEKRFWNMAAIICSNPTSRRLELWDAGIDWNKISDYELFVKTVINLTKEDTDIIFGDLDFSKFKVVKDNNDELVMIYTPSVDIQINEIVYLKMVDYVRTMLNMFPKVEKVKGKIGKEWVIEGERKKIKRAIEEEAKNPKRNRSQLLPLISAALNHPGFKYKKSELKEIGIVEFMDSIKRLQVYENTTSLMTGMYMGMLDTSKLNMEKDLNWTRDIYDN